MNLIRSIAYHWAALMLLTPAAGAMAAESLADAAERNDFRAVRELLENSTEANASQSDGTTALHWAAHYDDADAVRLLLAAGADANAANRYGITPLALACKNGNAATVELLLVAGADSNRELTGGETPLMIAARTGRLAPVEALLDRGVDVNARQQGRQTALMWATAEGHIPVIDALLEAGADVDATLRSGFTPLMFAVREGRGEAVLRLIDAGADVNEIMRPRRGNGKSTTALLMAVENGHFELAVLLLEAGANPNARPEGYTALHAITSVRKPIRGDGNPPPRGSGNLSSMDFVRQLVAQGADLDVRLEDGVSESGRFTTTGSTPFLMASRACDVPLMTLLVELGADPEIPNADDCSPLLAAAGVGALGDGDEAAGAEKEAIAAVAVLLDLGADVNSVDENGETAMHGAAYQSRATLVEFLAERSADIEVWNTKNKAGWTPLSIAHGNRPGNFRPAPDTIAAIERVMRAAGVEPPKVEREADRRKWD
ncbi:MAG: ankyrin repeat domain-containing protein [Pirellulales bacterium]|nr:ankyrin repeat domain-containing protein [Pirellulales bacterium]